MIIILKKGLKTNEYYEIRYYSQPLKINVTKMYRKCNTF